LKIADLRLHDHTEQHQNRHGKTQNRLGLFFYVTELNHGHAMMAQAVSRRPLTAEARVCGMVSPYGICMDKVAVGQVFNPCQYHSTVALHTFHLLHEQ
jgi:hypothetical protein